MDVLDAILHRRSIRNYKDIPIPRNVLADILLAGQYAPTAGNIYVARFVIVDDENVKDEIADACMVQSWMKTAPVFIVVIADVPKMEHMYPGRGKEYAEQSVAAAVENMLIMATSHGLASCWVAAFEDAKIRDSLKLPAQYDPVAIITLGYANEKPPTSAKLDLFALTYFNGFGGAHRMRDLDWVFKEYASSRQKDIGRGAKSLKSTFTVIKDSIKEKFKKKE